LINWRTKLLGGYGVNFPDILFCPEATKKLFQPSPSPRVFPGPQGDSALCATHSSFSFTARLNP
jgi:hypothetical protein